MASLSPLLNNFAAEDVAQLSTFGEARSYVDGDCIITEGDVNEYLYLVLRGKLDVSKHGESGPEHIAQITVTGSLGEMSVFDPGPASATVKATGDVEVWRISRSNLDRMHEVRPKVAYRLVCRICSVLAGRLRKLNQRFVDVN
ncbi:MAG: crp 1 [Verrucomicrobiaceae bacterium]|nr:crp 1 [Verrucomicrobiaceae bacterium]